MVNITRVYGYLKLLSLNKFSITVIYTACQEEIYEIVHVCIERLCKCESRTKTRLGSTLLLLKHFTLQKLVNKALLNKTLIV